MFYQVIRLGPGVVIKSAHDLIKTLLQSYSNHVLLQNNIWHDNKKAKSH